MKKSIIAVALLATIGSADAATVYDKNGTTFDIFGNVEVSYRNANAARYDKVSSYKSSDSTIMNNAKIGISGRSQINDNLYAVGMAQWDVASGDSFDDLKARHQFIGIDAQNYGTLLFGRGDNAFYTVAGVSDIFHDLDFDVSDYYLTGDQNPGLIMYTLSSLGWDLRASFGSAKSKVNDTPLNYKYQLAFSGSTRLQSNITISYAMAYYKFSYEGNVNDQIAYFAQKMQNMYHLNDNDIFSFANANRPEHKIDKGIAVSYGTFGDGLYAALNFVSTRYEHYSHHLYSYEAVIDYAFENGFGLTAGYGCKRFHHTNILSDLNLGARYSVNANFNLFAEAQFDISSNPEIYYSNEEITDRALAENKILCGAEFLF